MPMHATIRRYEYGGAAITADELVQVGRELSAHLGETQGFVSLLILDSSPELQGMNTGPAFPATGDPAAKRQGSRENRVLAIVSIFEDQVSLEQMDRLIATPLDRRLTTGCPARVQVTTGEVVFQRGL